MAVYRCPLCGNRFDEKDAEKCQGCLLAKKCNLVMCPNCNYEFPKIPLQKP